MKSPVIPCGSCRLHVNALLLVQGRYTKAREFRQELRKREREKKKKKENLINK